MYDILVGFSVNKEESIILQPNNGSVSKVILESLPRTIAGSSLNLVRVMDTLGSNKVKLVYTTGEDAHALDVMEALKNWGIDFSPLPVMINTPRTIVVIPNNYKQTKLYCYKPEYIKSLIPSACEKTVEQVSLCQPQYLVATGARTDDIALVESLFSGSGKKVLNPSYEMVKNIDTVKCLKPDLLVINHEEVCMGLGKKKEKFNPEEDIRDLFEKVRPQEMLVTYNSKGAYYTYYKSEKSCTEYIPAIETIETEVVDPTGAGDAFLGGYLHGLIRGLENFNALRFASAVAAAKIKKMGGSNAPTLNEVLSLLPKDFPTASLI